MRIFTKRAEIAVRTRCLRRVGRLGSFARRVLDIGAHVIRRDELGQRRREARGRRLVPHRVIGGIVEAVFAIIAIIDGIIVRIAAARRARARLARSLANAQAIFQFIKFGNLEIHCVSTYQSSGLTRIVGTEYGSTDANHGSPLANAFGIIVAHPH